MSTPSTPTASEAGAPVAKNRAAIASEIAAACAIAALVSFTTVVGWVAPAFFIAAAILGSLVAIVCGHVGRARGRSLGGIGRGVSLAGIIVGWITLAIATLGPLVLIGLLAGIAELGDR